MAEAEAIHVRPPEPIVITVCRAHNLVQYSDTDRVSKCGSQLNMRGSKGDAVNVMVKVEFNEKVLGETPKVDCSPDVPAEFNFSTTLNCTYEDPLALDEIAHKPVVLTVIEVMPKERRQKEEKTSTLGQCTLDLLPLVKGETNYRYTLVINPTPGSPLEAIPAENPRPELDVMLSVNEALLDEQQIKDGNLLTITVESLFSPPDSWQLTGQQFYYSAALPVPCNSEDPTEKKEMLVVFPGGQLKLGADKELPNKQKKWAVPGSAVGNSIFIPDSVIASDPVEDEDGDFKDKGDRDHRHLSESEKMRITWNTERRCYLENAAVKGFQDSVAKTRYWPIEIFRFPQPAGGKGKKLTSKLKDEEGTISYHGVAFLNLAPLLYPGVKRIRGAFKVLPYTDHLLHEKSKRKAGIGEEALRLSLNQLNRSSASPAPKKAGKEKAEAEKKDAKKGGHESIAKGKESGAKGKFQFQSLGSAVMRLASNTLKSDTGSEIDGQVPVNVEGQQYADSKSYIMIDICLTRPLVPKRPPEELARRVAELIPPRPAFPKRTDSADKAVEDYHCQIAGVASLLLEEFREMFGEDQGTGEPQTNEVMEGRRQKLMYHLNSSGKYFSFKEQLKHSVIKIVREKYLKTTNFDDRQQLQTFLSELYVYLVDQMHQSLNKVLQIEDQPPIPPPLTTNAQLKHFAREAEVNKNFDLATKYYQERIIREESNADNWFDFGTFCLYTNNVSKAEECFHKCISINQRHMDGLMLNGVVCTLAERNEAAETFFEAATNVDPKNILAWTMLGLFYDTISNDIGAEMAYLEANKLNIGQAASIARDEEQEKEKKEKEKAERAEKDGEATDTPQVEGSIVPPLSAGKSLTPSRPGSQLKEPARGTPVVGEAEAQEELPPREPTPIPAMSIYMQAVDWLLEVKAVPFTEQALAHELLTTPSGKTPAYHIATARVKLQKEEYEEAEQSLNDALQVEHQNPDGWALMGHVKYLNGDNHAARECYQRTLSFVTDATETHSIYLRLASIYLQDGEYQQAKQTFLMACKKSPSCVSWLGVGIACYRLGELGEAEDALMEANILNNSDPEVWGYLSLVCLRTARKVEAEQSYKHAVKLQLQDAALLNEIHAEQKKATFGNPEF
ncbi:cilia- and flagella-associated protein 70-like isoform X9 [Littorina saxatilis]|uniref:cilia- and flagella-associated protein 70-like isoform X9 n=1 Tax=Littorina saxatilis TaxID=31220 RepID=UPI0038B43DE2